MIKKINLIGSAIALISYFGILPEPNSYMWFAAALFFIGIGINVCGLAMQKHSYLAIFYVAFMAAVFFPGVGFAIHVLPGTAALLPLLLSLANPDENNLIQKQGSPF